MFDNSNEKNKIRLNNSHFNTTKIKLKRMKIKKKI